MSSPSVRAQTFKQLSTSSCLQFQAELKLPNSLSQLQANDCSTVFVEHRGTSMPALCLPCWSALAATDTSMPAVCLVSSTSCCMQSSEHHYADAFTQLHASQCQHSSCRHHNANTAAADITHLPTQQQQALQCQNTAAACIMMPHPFVSTMPAISQLQKLQAPNVNTHTASTVAAGIMLHSAC